MGGLAPVRSERSPTNDDVVAPQGSLFVGSWVPSVHRGARPVALAPGSSSRWGGPGAAALSCRLQRPGNAPAAWPLGSELASQLAGDSVMRRLQTCGHTRLINIWHNLTVKAISVSARQASPRRRSPVPCCCGVGGLAWHRIRSLAKPGDVAQPREACLPWSSSLGFLGNGERGRCCAHQRIPRA